MKATLQKESGTTSETNGSFVSPEVNIFETKEGYILEAEMPGVGKEGLEVTLEGNEITLVGRRQTEPINGKALFRETEKGNYRRLFELDPAIDSSKIVAKMEQGVLTLALPKSESVKPRKITVSD